MGSAQAEFETRRRARWGESARAAAGGPGGGGAFGGARYGAGRRDYLGYYAMLGLDATEAERVSQGDVKKAFREAALRWHPDRQKVRPLACGVPNPWAQFSATVLCKALLQNSMAVPRSIQTPLSPVGVSSWMVQCVSTMSMFLAVPVQGGDAVPVQSEQLPARQQPMEKTHISTQVVGATAAQLSLSGCPVSRRLQTRKAGARRRSVSCA